MILSEAELLNMLGAMPPLDRPEQLSLFPQSVTGNMPTDSSRSDRPMISQNPTPSPAPTINLESPLKEVFQAIPSEATGFDLIVEQAGMSAGEVSSALLQLELLGLVSQLPGMRYQRSPGS